MASNTRKKAADELGSQIKDLGDFPTGLDAMLSGAASPMVTQPSNDSPLAGAKPKPLKKTKYPCGKCDAEVTGNSVCCNSCELWFHAGCIEGMSKEYFDNCKKTFELQGFNAFLCKICRKVWTSMKKSLKEVKDEMKEMANKIVVLELEKETLAQKLEKIEMKADKMNDRVGGVEKEVATGMEKAKEEVKKDVRSEMTEREANASNVVLYGLEETKEADPAQWRAKEQKKVEEIIQKMGVEVQGEFIVKHRAGKPREEGAKPRPIVVKVADDEMRVNIFRNAPRLSRMDDTKKVYIAPDLTPQQRDEDRKAEAKLKEEAARKNEEEKKGPGVGRWVVVGARGRRRIVEADERSQQRQ
jgi:hypothetical protein